MRPTCIAILAAALSAGCASPPTTPAPSNPSPVHPSDGVQLGNFSVSLAVKDLPASQAFYETLGFQMIGGNPAQNWVILQNDTATIGLFQGFFEKNMLTFNPGWDRNSQTLPAFQDVRAIQGQLKEQGIEFTLEADAHSSGPASFVLMDPDGNPILVDQHVAKPAPLE